MTIAGIEIYNAGGNFIVSQDSLNSKAVFKTRSVAEVYEGQIYHRVDINLPFEYLKAEAPIIFVRPDALGVTVGGTQYSPFRGADNPYDGRGRIVASAGSPFDLVVFSTKGTPLLRDGPSLFEIFHADGSLKFSDRYMIPRLKFMGRRYPTPAGQGWPMRFDISGKFTTRPWFLAGPLYISGKGVGETGEYAGSVTGMVTSDMKTFIVDYSWAGPAAWRDGFDPYANRNGYFWLGDIGGI